ncbi:MAG: Maf family protein [Planctomycetota bacterium]
MTDAPRPRIVLASGSPRRRDLLTARYGAEAVRVMPPSSADEPSLDGLADRREICEAVVAIASLKADDVVGRLRSGPEAHDDWDVVVAADTAVIVSEDREDFRNGPYRALGKPPEGDRYAPTVRDWFRDYYINAEHEVVTGLSVSSRAAAGGLARSDFYETTTVRMHRLEQETIDRYIGSGEPLGKAGGYAIQGAAAAFIAAVEGDLSNVIGLPVTMVSRSIAEHTGHTDR